jgi:hypothetical protein
VHGRYEGSRGRPRERKGDEGSFSFFPALTDRANFWCPYGAGCLAEVVVNEKQMDGRALCMDVTKARAKKPREGKGDEGHFSFSLALTDRANFWCPYGAGCVPKPSLGMGGADSGGS